MALTQNSIVVTKVGDLIYIVYNGGSNKYKKYTKNMATGEHVGLLLDDKSVETNLLNGEDDEYVHSMFNTINGVGVTNNVILFDELEKDL